MSKAILITLNNSGNDLGPYDLFLVDGLGNETAWVSNPITKAVLIAGYQMIVPDNIVKVKIQSKTCTTYVLLIIPTTLCPCRTFEFTGVDSGPSQFTFYECGQIPPTTLSLGDITITRCIDTMRPITKQFGLGSYTDTNICCTNPPTT